MVSDCEARPVTWRTLLVTAAGLLGVLLVVSAGVAWWLVTNMEARFLIQDQRGWIRFPESLTVGTEIHDAVQVQVDQTIPAGVPVNQPLSIPVPDPIQAEVTVDTMIPVRMQVPVDDMLSIDQTIAVDAEVEVRVAGLPITLPIRGDIPIKADVPLQLMIDVDNQVPLQFTAPVTLRLPEPLETHLNTVIDTQIPIKGMLSLPVTSILETTLHFPTDPVEAGLYYLDVNLPLNTIRLAPLEGKQ